MSPFGKYDTVDIYIVDEDSVGRSYMFKQAAEIEFGSAASKLEATLFPEDVSNNRSCHIVITGNGNALDGTHNTLNSSSFFMIRTQQNVSGTMVPLPSPTATATATISTSLTFTTTATSTKGRPTTYNGTTVPAVSTGIPTNGALPSDKSASLSPLVIGLISAGCGALLIAIVAVFLLVRARRRYKGNTSYFKSLDDQPGSPTDGSTKGSSNFKSEDDQESAAVAARGEGGYGGALFAGSIAAERSSSNTARSAEPMIKGVPAMLPYHSQAPSSPIAPLPLLERKTSTLYNVPESAESAAAAAAAAATGAAAVGTTGRQNSVEKNPVLTANDAQLIAETFRKSMRKPQWENKHDDDDDETDEARRAANTLLMKELSEEGVDVQRGVQRRVTIQDRIIRTPGGSTLASRSLAIPPP
ncbi:hypothetical protein KI688_011184 [Linnemannia hyalina]|uniref:Mid2 domain-containing protein n=1 Tax=Linnemannia hyalina TaxID=64524 RepID=A0A9P7XZ70_9FUNG|nr:hypothetical protein KI688_011184 [Linnemannia hyalina]